MRKVLDLLHLQFLEDLSEWFEMNVDSPYMLLVANINSNKKLKRMNKNFLV